MQISIVSLSILNSLLRVISFFFIYLTPSSIFHILHPLVLQSLTVSVEVDQLAVSRQTSSLTTVFTMELNNSLSIDPDPTNNIRSVTITVLTWSDIEVTT